MRDGTSNLVSQTSYYDDDLVKETFVPDPVGKTATMVSARRYTYTCRKELKTSENRNCAGSTTVYGDLPGQVDTVTDALGRVAKTEYESTTQRPTAQWTAYGLPGASKVESVWTNGLLTQTKVFNPSTGSYDSIYARTYDKANRLELFSYPSGLGLSSEATSYNSFGETLAMITTSRTITHAYNSLGQNTTKTWSGAYSNVVTMEYDDAGHQKTLSEGSGGSQLRKETTFHAWKGTPNVETFKVGGSTWKSQTHVHDVSGNYIKFTDPEGKDHEWTVDNAGRVQDVKHDGVVVMSLTYTPGGLLDTTTVKNASGSPIFKTTHYYDELGRKSRQVTAKSSNGAVISAYRWEYDAGDRVVKLKLEHLGVEFVYGYDERDQLTSETTEGNSATGAPAFTNNIVSLPVGNEGAASNEPTIQTQNVLAVSARSASWTYDKAGNRTAMTIDGVSTSFSYNAGSQLTSETWSSKTVSHTYDEWGNEITRTTVEGVNTTVETYGYNYLNVMASYVRTLSVDGGDPVTQANWQYQFWPTGDRYGKVDLITSGNSEYYVPRMGDVAADYTNTLAIKNTYVQGTGIDSKSIRIPWSGGSPDNANRRHYLGDLVGTIGITLTETATVAETSVKDAWGNQIAGSTTERYGGLAQRETDGESSLVFVRARMYDPVRGRLLSSDPLRFRVDLAHYLYGNNSPTVLSDPTGLQEARIPLEGVFDHDNDRAETREGVVTHIGYELIYKFHGKEGTTLVQVVTAKAVFFQENGQKSAEWASSYAEAFLLGPRGSKPEDKGRGVAVDTHSYTAEVHLNLRQAKLFPGFTKGKIAHTFTFELYEGSTMNKPLALDHRIAGGGEYGFAYLEAFDGVRPSQKYKTWGQRGEFFREYDLSAELDKEWGAGRVGAATGFKATGGRKVLEITHYSEFDVKSPKNAPAIRMPKIANYRSPETRYAADIETKGLR